MKSHDQATARTLLPRLEQARALGGELDEALRRLILPNSPEWSSWSDEVVKTRDEAQAHVAAALLALDRLQGMVRARAGNAGPTELRGGIGTGNPARPRRRF